MRYAPNFSCVQKAFEIRAGVQAGYTLFVLGITCLFFFLFFLARDANVETIWVRPTKELATRCLFKGSRDLPGRVEIVAKTPRGARRKTRATRPLSGSAARDLLHSRCGRL
jgi:hypothetical protein